MRPRYWLKVEPEILTTQSFGGSQDVEGLKEVTGEIQIISGSLPGAFGGGEQFILELEDGRRLPFYPDGIGSTIRIVAAGGLE